MLDENLPTFSFQQSSSDPLQTVLSFSQGGSDKAPEYIFRKADPALPESRNKYASALSDAVNPSILFAEVVINPEWTQPTLSAAEIRANNGIPPPQVPMIPEAFTIQLFNPDQQVVVRGEKSTWTGKESFDFEMPQVSFLKPSNSEIDRSQEASATGSSSNNPNAPKIMFRWKRDGKFSKDMTCYMTGRSVQGRKSKEPDITVAMFTCGREQAITIYEPNLQRVEVEDRKGLEVVLLLSAEVIREIYLFPNRDSFNISGSSPATTSKRKNSRPLSPAQALAAAAVATSEKSKGYTMSGAMVTDTPPKTGSPLAQPPTGDNNVSSRPDPQVEAEAKRLQALAEQEKRDKEKRDREEQRRIKKQLEQEEKEQKRREADVSKETERLRKLYGMEGQDYGPKPTLPPRPTGANHQPQPQTTHHHQHSSGGSGGGGAVSSHLSKLNVAWNNIQAPARPVSAGPPPKASGSGFSRFFHSSGDGYAGQQQQPPPQSQPPKSSRRRKSDEGSKIKKKKSGIL
ncbi:chromatin assembly factor 1 subunit A [Microdochium nivale]|nr:chromatin assembly factor 1 subunit A [Microdochium nivale]